MVLNEIRKRDVLLVDLLEPLSFCARRRQLRAERYQGRCYHCLDGVCTDRPVPEVVTWCWEFLAQLVRIARSTQVVVGAHERA